jgi:hypothetical protein
MVTLSDGLLDQYVRSDPRKDARADLDVTAAVGLSTI